MAPTRFDNDDDDRTVVRNGRDRASLHPGDKILNETYVIHRLLGKGGMGEVYQAEHIELGSRRAIKIISPEFAQDEQYVGLFIEEARKLSQVNNDAIVRYYEFSRGESGARYLVMEYVGGQSLADSLQDRRLEPSEALELLHRVSEGLAAAYDQGIKAHRDISPANILLPEGRVDLAKVIDFGIAKSADPAAGTVIGSDFAGKYSFVSPEQAGLFGGQDDVGERSDIYSLGLVLAAAAIGFGKRLDMGSEPVSVIRARQSVPDLSRVPAQLHPLLTRMLQPRPQDRPASMRALAAEAERLLRNGAGGGPDPTSRASTRRGKLRWALGGLVASGLAVAGAVLVLWPRAEPPPRIVSDAPTPPAPPAVTLAPSAAAAPSLPTPRATETPAVALAPPASAPPAAAQPSLPTLRVTQKSAEPPVAAPLPLVATSPAQPPSPPPPPPAAPEPAGTVQAMVTPPPPAPVKPADPRGELTAALAHLDCASVHTTAAPDGRDVIAGTVSTAADRATLLAIAARLSEPHRPRFDLEVVPAPVCSVLAQFGEWQTAGIAEAGAVDVRLSHGAETLHQDDPIAVDVTSRRNYPLYLRIDYFTLGGQVLHMWPNAEMTSAILATDASQEFLKSGAGNKVWRVGGAPFGVELISVTATRLPLKFGSQRPAVERASDYLAELKRALDDVGSLAQPLVATVLVHTAEK